MNQLLLFSLLGVAFTAKYQKLLPGLECELMSKTIIVITDSEIDNSAAFRLSCLRTLENIVG